jgi:hypothetical protein
MRSEIIQEILQTIETEVQSRPTPVEFEMAYQARVAMDRIRFVIKHVEQFGPRTDQMREAGLQLLNALERLEVVDRRFQDRARTHSLRESSEASGECKVINGKGKGFPPGRWSPRTMANKSFGSNVLEGRNCGGERI